MLRCPDAGRLRERFASMSLAEFARRTEAAERALHALGVTFTVYSDGAAIDRILPFDAIPRVIAAGEWRHIERGVIQRVTALNLLLDDLYHRQMILRDGVLPCDLILGNDHFRPLIRDLTVPHKAYVNICGTDIIRGDDGVFHVLEDNARTPSGVSYVIENRNTMQRAFPDLLNGIGLRGVDGYGLKLVAALGEIAPPRRHEPIRDEPCIVLLSPGAYNSAYFEHVFLARDMGVPLVEGRDLIVENERVYMRTIDGLTQVDVIYRRINDDFLDPEAFRPDSRLGVSGLMHAYISGNVALANAVGTGVADDKAVYAYMPRIIRYYLSEEPVLPNVETYTCRDAEGLRYTLDHLDRLVVKPVGAAGRYGLTIGPRASRAELAECRAKLLADPANYISQPCINLSVAPTLCDGRIAARHVDLRPFAITGKETWVLPGGLTRVAMQEGSLIVNSSQGGGSKDTWVLE